MAVRHGHGHVGQCLQDVLAGGQVESVRHEEHRGVMLGLVVAGHAVLGDDHVVVAEHRVPGGRLDAPLGRAASDHDRLDAVTAQQHGEVGAPERARPVLLDHQLAVPRLQPGTIFWPSRPVDRVRQRRGLAVVPVVQPEVEPDLRGRVAGPVGQHGHLDEDRQHTRLARCAEQAADPLDHRRVGRDVHAQAVETPSAQQKSRCMSTISSAVCAGSTISDSSVNTCLPATSIMAVVERRARSLSRSWSGQLGEGRSASSGLAGRHELGEQRRDLANFPLKCRNITIL